MINHVIVSVFLSDSLDVFSEASRIVFYIYSIDHVGPKLVMQLPTIHCGARCRLHIRLDHTRLEKTKAGLSHSLTWELSTHVSDISRIGRVSVSH